MPFYVDYSTKRRNIDIRDASPIQFIICEAFGYIVTLDVLLNDYVNHRNVTFEWVQTHGTSVVLSHPYELITTFEYTDTSDKRFRFYIDKDTAREKYVDCRVYHTPISFMGAGYTGNTVVGTEVVRVSGRTDTSKVNFSRTIVPTVTGIPAVRFGLEYVAPQELLNLSTLLEVVYSGDTSPPHTVIDSYLPGSYPDSYVAIAGKYEFRLTIVFPSGNQAQFTSPVHVSSPKVATATAGKHIVDDLTGITPLNSAVAISKFTYKKQTVFIENEIGFASGRETSLTRYGNVSCSTLSELTNPILIGYDVQTVTITKLNPSGVGSPG